VDEQTHEIWHRLAHGKSLAHLGIPTRDGRVDLRGLLAPQVKVTPLRPGVDALKNITVVRSQSWRDLDFSTARLDSLRFFDCKIENCLFEGCQCRDWRMWGTTVADSSFDSADLRKAALGGVDNGKRNIFRRVDFSRADFRQTAHGSAEMIDCIFNNAKLVKVDFQGTVFVRCRFVGELNDVLFYQHGFRGEAFPPNEMESVDFSNATLRNVEFRGLDMASVKWPNDGEHIVIDNYCQTLDRALALLEMRSDVPSRKLRARLAVMRKWAGPNQLKGIINKADLINAGGEDAVREFVSLAGLAA
jgi:uncharacterized protein YjbI with pentapeptide repeats